METLENLEQKSLDYRRRHHNTGGASEFDTSINDISRAKIEAYHALHGRIWLVKINRYDDTEKADPHLVEYTGQFIYNFAFSFAVHQYDQTLINLLEEYEKPLVGPFKSKEIIAKIDRIFKRADDIGCVCFQWS